MSQDWFKGKYPPSVFEAFACSLFLMRLGYEPKKDFSVEVTNTVYVVLTISRPKFGIPAGPLEIEQEKFNFLLTELKNENLSDAEIDFILSTSRILRYGSQITHALQQIGLRPIQEAANS